MRDEDIEATAKYFASGGSLWDADRPRCLFWLPYGHGKVMRFFWRKSCAAVKKRVKGRAYALLEQEFGRARPARNFDQWPTPERRELYKLCEPTGCAFHVDEHGNVLPIGWTMDNYLQKAREHLAHVERE